MNRGPFAVYETAASAVLTCSNVERHVEGLSVATIRTEVINIVLLLEYKNARTAHQVKIRITSISNLLNRHYYDYLVSNSLSRLPFASIQCFLRLSFLDNHTVTIVNMSHRSGQQNVVKTERGSSASQASLINPKSLQCYELSPGNHYTLGKYSSNYKTESLQGTKYYKCQLSNDCVYKRLNSLNDLENHIHSQHMEKLCGFIGRRDDRQEHVDTSRCHDGSERRRKRDKGLANKANAEEQKRFKDGERRRMRYEAEDRSRMSGNDQSSGTSESSGNSGKRRS
ncbi:hypothetical protein BPAE_0005g01290 [Botrytis paeoniae]|uniref:Uncharacterized protein n=1 Tax=Botrytis paeoniae TaxID=278948 RepID=A0A4Z1G8G8_9HELO|nr:hypothetical protein BPAE_0005g01290 [Botrytis paeoniae]